ncbi:ferredoxin--NADP reductase [Flavicella sediminum]|uniref:ferredoxin--NADP reductase n=1 Tax=Flavicella sediminum TaxID=2585141 RepID=UPI001121A2D1|nr:ferredoxin--NADP reductase [Flavicella sediminum]
MKLAITNIKKETEQAVTVSFKNNRFFNKIKYKPGQFLTLKIPINGRIESRAYSFSSNPFTVKELNITVKKVENGLVSNYINSELKVGQKIDVEKPMGSFYIEPSKNANQQYILFGAGSGITPVYSILTSVLDKEPLSKILLIYANHDIENIIFLKELQDLAEQHPDRFRVEHILSHNTQPNFHSGFITKNLVEKIFKKNSINFTNHKYMICGPAGYMKSVKEILKSKSVPLNNIQTEAFKPAKIKIDRKNLISQVQIKHKGATHKLQVPGNRTILQQAMENNIVLPYSCRSGMCSTCKAQCTDGEIILAKGHLLPDDEVANGTVLTCISYPKSEQITIEIPN